PRPAAGPARGRRGRRHLGPPDRRWPPGDILRVVRPATAELHGPHREHGQRGRVRAVPDAQGRAVRGRRRLAAAPDLALRQELAGPACPRGLAAAAPPPPDPPTPPPRGPPRQTPRPRAPP